MYIAIEIPPLYPNERTSSEEEGDHTPKSMSGESMRRGDSSSSSLRERCRSCTTPSGEGESTFPFFSRYLGCALFQWWVGITEAAGKRVGGSYVRT